MKKSLHLILLLFFAMNVSSQVAEISLRAILQGAWDPVAGSMRTNVSHLATFPLQQPYDVSPWYHTGRETLSMVPDSMVDWVLVELRCAPDTIVARRAAILLRNGRIVDTDLSSPVGFLQTGSGTYYVVVHHRNHFPVMTATAVAFPHSQVIDFTDTMLTAPWGGGAQALAGLGNGLFGMIAGDINLNNQLKYSGPGNDRSLILQRITQVSGATTITTTVSGYYREDLTMDSVVKYSGPGNDQARIIQNLVSLTGSTAITSLYNGVLPPAVWRTAFKNCGDMLTDPRDGQQYPTVQIGGQCWMAENLNIGSFAVSIPLGTGNWHSDVSNNGFIEKYCYDNNVDSCDKWGGLYDWDEMMEYVTPPRSRGICPPGWHLPDDAEWEVMVSFLGGENMAGGKLKVTDPVYWEDPNSGATNTSGFNAIASGYRYDHGSFNVLGYNAFYWTSSDTLGGWAWFRKLSYDDQYVEHDWTDQRLGYSVRCIIDTFICTPMPDQANAGPDSLGIPGDSIQLYANTPVFGTGAWSLTSGPGGQFSDSTSPSSMFYGQAGAIYSLVWTITNSCGSSSDTMQLGFMLPFSCGDTLVDMRDGQQYPTVLIGTQCWMAKNLNIGNFVQSIAGLNHSDVSDNGIIEKYCYNNNTSWCDIYGGLYDWDEMMGYDTNPGGHGICPPNGGWHIPTDEELKVLEGTVDSQYGVGDPEWDGTDSRGYDAGNSLKEAGYAHWGGGNSAATNSSGFTGLPGGQRRYDGHFYNEESYGYIWSSSVRPTTDAWNRRLRASSQLVYRNYQERTSGYSVRCLKD